MQDTETKANAFQLANMADVASPDSEDSPGAKFLLGIADTVEDYKRYADDDGQGIDSLEDQAHEIADGAVPIYTYEKWQVFTDLAAWQEDVDEFGPIEDMDKGASVALFLIADRLVRALIEDGDES